MEGEFQPETLFEILVHAANNAESIEQRCKTLEDIPTSNDVRYHLNKLENLEELEEQLNLTLLKYSLKLAINAVMMRLKAYAMPLSLSLEYLSRSGGSHASALDSIQTTSENAASAWYGSHPEAVRKSYTYECTTS
jgi:hypothetical protein